MEQAMIFINHVYISYQLVSFMLCFHFCGLVYICIVVPRISNTIRSTAFSGTLGNEGLKLTTSNYAFRGIMSKSIKCFGPKEAGFKLKSPKKIYLFNKPRSHEYLREKKSSHI